MNNTLKTLQSVFDQLNIGVSVLNSSYEFTYCNSLMADVMGSTPQQIIGRTQYDIMLEAYERNEGVNIETDDIHKWLANLKSSQNIYCERSFTTDTVDGRYFRMYRITVSGGSHLYFAMDITEQEQTKKKLEKSIKVCEIIATTDELTGVKNRRAIVENIKNELNRCKRYQDVFSVIIVDIDLFKKVNDTYGHLVGDTVIKRTSKVINDSLRDTDCLGRFGGEEFIILLPKTNKKGAIIIAERIRKKVENNSIEMDSSDSLAITISLGVSEYMQSDHDVSELIKRADDCLYSAKNNGRNQVFG